MPRRNRRKSKRFQLDYLYCRTDPETNGFCLVKDLSLTGAQVLHRQPPAIGSKIVLWFERKPLTGLQAAGQVVRHNQMGEAGFGVEFDGPNLRLLLAAVGNKAN
jgi:hypothetical protein